ncbi:hypothetical protein TNCV_2260311 [Trichonephila clavipes]|nr:hypothetical protein TNCV_2260311 [Trichonephila clavipes]
MFNNILKDRRLRPHQRSSALMTILPGIVVSDAMPFGLCSYLREGIDICKRFVPLWHGTISVCGDGLIAIEPQVLS